MKMIGRAKMLRIYIGEDDEWEGAPLYSALVERFRALDVAGATVYRGAMGYGSRKRLHREKRLALSGDRPIVITVVDTEEKIRTLLPMLDLMIRNGLIVVSDVDVVKYTPGPQATAAAGWGTGGARQGATPTAARSGAPRMSAGEPPDATRQDATTAGEGTTTGGPGAPAGDGPGVCEPIATAAAKGAADVAQVSTTPGTREAPAAAEPAVGAGGAPQPDAAPRHRDRPDRRSR